MRWASQSADRFPLAMVPLLSAMFFAACGGRRAELQRTGAPSASGSKAPQLTTLAAGNLFDAYAGGGADAIYRGRRYRLVGNVVSVSVDAGIAQVVLGSKLKPVVATDIDSSAALALVPDSAIQIDCTVTGASAEIPKLDCGPNGVPRPVSPPP